MHDRDHDEKKAKLRKIGKRLLVVGGIFELIGLAMTFASVPLFASRAEQHAPAAETMGVFALFGFGGVTIAGFASFAIMIGIVLYAMSYLGEATRYRAAEQAPVANEVAEGLARAVKKGLAD